MTVDTPASPSGCDPEETVLIVASGVRIVLVGAGARPVLATVGDGELASRQGTISIEAVSDSRLIHVALDTPPARAVAPGPTDAGGGELTPRQLEVVQLLAQGVRAAGIAARLGVSASTARNHIRGALRRLGCHSQLEAVAEARRRHLLDA